MSCSPNCARGATACVLLLLAGCAAQPAAEAPAPVEHPAAVAETVSPPPDPQLEAVRTDFEIALATIASGDLDSAAALLRDIAERVPQAATPLANLARVQERLGQFDAAAQSLQEAITRRPEAAFYNALGVLQRKQGKFNEARRSYEQALAVNGDYAPAHHNLAVLCDLYLDEPATALEHYRHYQRLADQNEQGQVAGWIAELDRRLKERP